MAYRMTPSTQSTMFSPYTLVSKHEMCTPLDTALLLRENLSLENAPQLEPILQGLEHFRNIAKANTEIAQNHQKAQYDKKTEDPSYLPGQRVWLYCTKVPVGQNAKLWRKMRWALLHISAWAKLQNETETVFR